MSNFVDIFEIPQEYVSKSSKIVVVEFEEVIIENFKMIIEYESFLVRISTYTGIVNINGFNLTINQINDESIAIKGKIKSLDFEEGQEKK